MRSNSREILLEVFDRSHSVDRCLGLGIVAIEEIVCCPSQRQIIPLQAGPYQEDGITGSLTVEVIILTHLLLIKVL